MKRGKEITLDVNKNYKIKIGTVDNKNPKSVYINLSAWGELNESIDVINYDSVINKLRKNIKQNINSIIDKKDFHINRYIVDMDMRSSGISSEKRSFMSCEITLFQKNNIPINKPKIINAATDIVNDVIINCLDNQKHFNFYKTKK